MSVLIVAIAEIVAAPRYAAITTAFTSIIKVSAQRTSRFFSSSFCVLKTTAASVGSGWA